MNNAIEYYNDYYYLNASFMRKVIKPLINVQHTYTQVDTHIHACIHECMQSRHRMHHIPADYMQGTLVFVPCVFTYVYLVQLLVNNQPKPISITN